MEALSTCDQKNGIIYLSPPNPGFEKLYIAVRDQEKRLYSPEELLLLPYVPALHPYYAEWQARQESFVLLQDQLIQARPQYILEIGCGNGWLAHQLGQATGAYVYALDVNATELEQGAKVFKSDRLVFVYADIFDLEDNGSFLPKFDAIIMAASLQYFPNIDHLLKRISDFLQPNGAIHILDTPFYKTKNLPHAQARSLHYYAQLGFPEMAQYYFHHSWESIEVFSPEIVYKPSTLNQWLSGKKNPFPYLKIRKNKIETV
jgi:ubiquinone/menaquinone biosynthesis C-methylase UbiE